MKTQLKSIWNKSMLRIGGAALSMLIALSMMAVVVPQPAYAAGSSAATCVDQYTVKKDDTKSMIAANNNLKWWQIAEANKMAPTTRLTAGETLCIPTGETVRSEMPGTMTATATGNTLAVKMANFINRGVWTVKVKDASPSATEYFKVGKIIAPENGSVTGIYQLPKDLRATPTLRVCTTNTATSSTICQKINNVL